jgi:hypothetical protein
LVGVNAALVQEGEEDAGKVDQGRLEHCVGFGVVLQENNIVSSNHFQKLVVVFIAQLNIIFCFHIPKSNIVFRFLFDQLNIVFKLSHYLHLPSSAS